MLVVLFFCFFLMIRRPPRSTLLTHSFPTRRSSDLSEAVVEIPLALAVAQQHEFAGHFSLRLRHSRDGLGLRPGFESGSDPAGISFWCAAWNCGDDAGTAADPCTGTGGVSSIESVNTSPSAGGPSFANGAERLPAGRGLTG